VSRDDGRADEDKVDSVEANEPTSSDDSSMTGRNNDTKERKVDVVETAKVESPTLVKPTAVKASTTVLKRSPRRSQAKTDAVQSDRSNLVMVVGLPALGIMLAYVTNRQNRNAPAYLGDFTADIRKSLSNMAAKLDIHAVKDMVDDNDSTMPKRVPVPKRESLKVAWPVFIRICEDPNKAGEKNSRLKWGRNVTKAISFFAQRNFDYPSDFELGFDLTDKSPNIKGGSLADFLTFDDTLDVMVDNYYVGTPKETIIDNEDAMRLFYGNKYTAAAEHLGNGQEAGSNTMEDLQLEDM